jgi:hypothetical protein
MLRSLPGADPGTAADGERLVKRALELFKDHLSTSTMRNVTIAVGEVAGLQVAVVYHPIQQKAERLAGKLRKGGVAATATSGDDHAEVALYQREPNVPVIGLSNPKGPCPACRKFFGNTPNGFANVYWDTDGWIR